MHEIWRVVCDWGVSVAWCVGLRVTPAKTDERIEVLFALETLGSLRNIGLDGGPDPPTGRVRGSGERWQQLYHI